MIVLFDFIFGSAISADRIIIQNLSELSLYSQIYPRPVWISTLTQKGH